LHVRLQVLAGARGACGRMFGGGVRSHILSYGSNGVPFFRCHLGSDARQETQETPPRVAGPGPGRRLKGWTRHRLRAAATGWTRGLLERPEDLGSATLGEPASIWQRPAASALASAGFRRGAIYQCECSPVDFAKPTGLLTDVPGIFADPDFHDGWPHFRPGASRSGVWAARCYVGPLPAACRHGSHQGLIRQPGDIGFRTSGTAAYHGDMCERLARHIVDDFASRCRGSTPAVGGLSAASSGAPSQGPGGSGQGPQACAALALEVPLAPLECVSFAPVESVLPWPWPGNPDRAPAAAGMNPAPQAPSENAPAADASLAVASGEAATPAGGIPSRAGRTATSLNSSAAGKLS
jgi:hypothetical protein